MTAEISAKLVKELRDQTGAPMMDTKRALQETNGDLEAAKRLLRERGMAQAAKRAGRETTEGLVGYRLGDGDAKGTIVAVGCETEPVSKNDEFQAFAKKVLETVEAGGTAAVGSLDEVRAEIHAHVRARPSSTTPRPARPMRSRSCCTPGRCPGQDGRGSPPTSPAPILRASSSATASPG